MADAPTATASTGIFTLIVSTGLLSALFTQFVVVLWDWVKERRAKKYAAHYSALRLASILESFALLCAHKIYSNNGFEWWERSRNEFNLNIPALEPFPNDIEWKAISPKLVGKVLSFPDERMIGNRAVYLYATQPNNSPEEGPWMSSLVCGSLGLKAWTLSGLLRKEYDLMEFRLGVEKQILLDLEEYSAKYEEAKDQGLAETSQPL